MVRVTSEQVDAETKILRLIQESGLVAKEVDYEATNATYKPEQHDQVHLNWENRWGEALGTWRGTTEQLERLSKILRRGTEPRPKVAELPDQTPEERAVEIQERLSPP